VGRVWYPPHPPTATPLVGCDYIKERAATFLALVSKKKECSQTSFSNKSLKCGKAKFRRDTNATWERYDLAQQIRVKN